MLETHGEYKHTLFSPERTLGSYAMANQHLSIEDWLVDNTLDSARTTMTQYQGPLGDMFERYMNGIVPPLAFASVRQQEVLQNKKLSWREWLMTYAEESEIFDILEVHNSVLQQHAASEAIAQDIDTLQTKFISALHLMNDRGLIASHPEHPSSFPIYYGDIFDTHLKQRGGYYEDQTGEIVLGQGYKVAAQTHVEEARQELPRVLTHEWVHASLGNMLEDVYSPLSIRWLNEGFTEMVSKAIRDKSGESLEEDNVYIHERQLVESLVGPERNPEVWRYKMMRAFTGTDNDRHEFVQYIDGLWKSEDVIRKVTRAVSAEERLHAETGSLSQTVQNLALIAVRERVINNPDSILRK